MLILIKFKGIKKRESLIMKFLQIYLNKAGIEVRVLLSEFIGFTNELLGKYICICSVIFTAPVLKIFGLQVSYISVINDNYHINM